MNKFMSPQRKLMIELAKESIFWKILYDVRNKKYGKPGEALEQMLKARPDSKEIIQNLKSEDIQNIRFPNL